MKRLVALAALAALLVVGAHDGRAADTTVKKLTLAQAVDAAVSDNPELAIQQRSIDVADARVESAKRLRLPVLSVDANLNLWDSPLDLSFELPPGVNIEFPPTRVRDQVTSTSSVTLTQPISGLTVVGKMINVERSGKKLAEAQLSGARLDVATQAATLYLRAMQARAGVDIASQTVTQLDAQAARAKTLEASGVLAKVDLMKIDSRRSQAAQDVLGAQDGFAQALDALALLLGLPSGNGLETVDDLPQALPPPPWDEPTALQIAAAKRPELLTAQVQAEQADGAVLVKRADYFPNIMAIGQYQHNEGQGALGQKNAAFVGLTLKWNIFDWGKRGEDMREVRGRAAQAHLIANRAKDNVALDVRGKLRSAQTSYKQLDVAQQGLATAEEAYRIESVRFQNGGATTLDVLDAETDVARARLAVVNHRYEYAIALVQLAHAIGEQPLAAFSPRAAAGGESRLP
jgi:outer membrane protein